jgi:glycerophosphoryl diester phosphodiesterase
VQRALAFAHRGGAHHPEIEGMENTVKAFKHAYDLGYRRLETDVHLSKDGVLFAFHDNVLDRVSDSVGTLADLTADEVRRARIAGTEPIPTLAELFDALPEAQFNIDLKSSGAVSALADFIEERGVADRVIVGSFSGARLQAFRDRTKGRVRTSAHSREVFIYRLSPTAGIARLLTRGRPMALQIPHHHKGIRVVTPGLVRRAHRNGLEVHVWTIDDPAEMQLLLDRGVDGLMTDRTDILKQVLTDLGQWEEGTE